MRPHSKQSFSKKSNLILLAWMLEVCLSAATYVPYLPGFCGGGRGGWLEVAVAKTWLKCKSRDEFRWIRHSCGSSQVLQKRTHIRADVSDRAKGHMAFMFLNHCLLFSAGWRQSCQKTPVTLFLFKAKNVVILRWRTRFSVLQCKGSCVPVTVILI